VEGLAILPSGMVSLGRSIREAEYRVSLSPRVEVTAEGIRSFLASSEVRVGYEKEGKIRVVDGRKGVLELELEETSGSDPALWMLLSVTENGRPYEVLSALSGPGETLFSSLRWQRLRFRGPGIARFIDKSG